jgi:uncharacterized protein YebE (UPF0316 family)
VTLPIGHTVATPPILPILVFIAETCVVTISTVRTIFITRGRKELAALLGFFEVSIWLFAIAQVMQNLSSLDCYVAFAGGFSLGNFLGVFIERVLALGAVAVYITTQKDASELVIALHAANYRATVLNARDPVSALHLVYMSARRKDLNKAVSIIKRFDPQAVCTFSDLQAATENSVPSSGMPSIRFVTNYLRHTYRVLKTRAVTTCDDTSVALHGAAEMSRQNNSWPRQAAVDARQEMEQGQMAA